MKKVTVLSQLVAETYAFPFAWRLFALCNGIFQGFVVEILRLEHKLFGYRNSDLNQAHATCSAVIPWYLKKPQAANGAAPRMHIQPTSSLPISGRKPKYRPTATPTASREQINCRVESPKRWTPDNPGFPLVLLLLYCFTPFTALQT